MSFCSLNQLNIYFGSHKKKTIKKQFSYLTIQKASFFCLPKKSIFLLQNKKHPKLRGYFSVCLHAKDIVYLTHYMLQNFS